MAFSTTADNKSVVRI